MIDYINSKKNTLKNSKNNEDGLTINEEYAKKFTYEKQRQFIEKAKLKYGKNFSMEELENQSSSDYESEDSDAEMINEKVMTKFIDTYIKLKDDKLAKQFLDNKDPVFNDEDFASKGRKKSNEKIEFTVNDALMNYKEEDENIFSVNYKSKKINKEDPEKKEFLKQLEAENNDDNEYIESDVKFVDDGFLKVKPKSSIIVVDDNNYNNPTDKPEELEIENLELSQALKNAKIKPEGLDVDLLQKIWGDDKNLDKNEKFLRNYILSEAWLENNENKINKHLLLIDKEDEEKDEIFDEFEFKYNHRFEEDGGANITTYQRNITDSYRIKDDSRADKRKQREIRKEEEKNRMKAELQIIKDAKRDETKKKVAAIERVAGTEKIKELLEELENEFDFNKFDEKMNRVFNEEYYRIADKEEDLKSVILEKSFDYKTNKSILNSKQLKQLEELENDGHAEGDLEAEADEAIYNYDDDYNGYNEEDNNKDENEWYYCDECRKVIKENKIKYECETCDDYIICKDCFKSISHAHKMKKSKVELGCKAPENWREIIENTKNKDENVLPCTNCSTEITADYYFTCSDEQCSDVKICKTCRGIGKSVHEHKLSKFFIEKTIIEEEVNPKEKLNNLIEGVYAPVTDDIIAKQIPTKFHYTKTDKEDLGLTDEMLILLDDHTLNKYIPLKRLAPYKGRVRIEDWQKKKMIGDLSKELERKKNEFIKISEQTDENIKNNVKLLQIKRKPNKVDKNDIKKRKRLETYGIIPDA